MTGLTPVTNKPTFLNPKLERLTQRIIKLDGDIKTRQYDIAATLATVDIEGLFKDDGFTSTVEYATATFGIQKSLAYALVTIGRDYTREIHNDAGKVIGHCSNLLKPSNPEKQDAPLLDFTTTQIMRFITLGREKVLELVESGDLSPKQTVNEILKVVKENKVKKVTEQPEQPTQEQEQPEQPEQPTQEQPTQEQEKPEQEQPTQEQPETTIDTTRGTGFDNIPSDVLIAELRLRGFRVFDHSGEVEMRYKWGE